MIQDANAKDPLLSGRAPKTLTAVAYYIRASSLGRPLSMYDVESMFGVSDAPFRKCYKRMAVALGVTKSGYVHKRSRNAYDLYAEILKNQGNTITQLIGKTHVQYNELDKHLNTLVKRGLLAKSKIGAAKVYMWTDKGREYLESYDKLKSLLENPA